eukprot:SAG11_NODE_27455_length_332_cov_1.115880_1_plen_37_part_01
MLFYQDAGTVITRVTNDLLSFWNPQNLGKKVAEHRLF